MMTTLTPMVKKLIFINIGVWLILQVIVERFFLDQPWITEFLSLIPLYVLEKFYVWQVFTYQFLHSTDGLFHIFINMLSLWWFGSELEQRWGSRFFLIYYLTCGAGAGVIYLIGVIVATLFQGAVPGAWVSPVLGASGAVFGVLLAYGKLFGERVIYFMMIFPMKAKVFVWIIAAVELSALLLSGVGQSRVANLAHLGGFVTGYLFLLFWTRFQQKRWRKKTPRRGRNLRLVVNNKQTGNGEDEDGPRYWN